MRIWFKETGSRDGNLGHLSVSLASYFSDFPLTLCLSFIMCSVWIGKCSHTVWRLYGRKCCVRMKGQRDIKKNKMPIKVCSERVDAERDTNLITSSLFPTIFQRAKKRSMYFSSFPKSHFLVSFLACIWVKDWILLLFKSRGETCKFRPGS